MNRQSEIDELKAQKLRLEIELLRRQVEKQRDELKARYSPPYITLPVQPTWTIRYPEPNLSDWEVTYRPLHELTCAAPGVNLNQVRYVTIGGITGTLAQ